jgi:hypothetical protein
MDRYRGIAFYALRAIVWLAIAALLIFMVLPGAIAAQAAAQ